MDRQLEDKAKLERLQFRAEVRGDVNSLLKYLFSLSPVAFSYCIIHSNRSSQKRTKLKEQLGLDDRWGVESSDSEGKISPNYDITNVCMPQVK